MKDRIVKFIETEHLTAAEFADKIGVQRSSVSHVLNGRNNPGFSFIQKILEAFPLINSRWLLTGQGELNEAISPKVEFSDAPDLFSTKAAELGAKSIPIKKETAPVKEAEKEVLPEETKEIAPFVNTDKTIKRVLIFYTDHTFEDFRPAN